MDRRTSLRRRVALVGASVLLVVGLAGCEGNGPVGPAPVATVNGHEITRDDVTELMDAQTAYLQAAIEAAGATDTPEATAALDRYRGENEFSISTAGASEALTTLIDIELYKAALADLGGEVTEEDRTAVTTSIQSSLTQSQVTVSPEIQPLIDAETERGALYTALQRAAVDVDAREQQLQEIFEANEVEFEQLCVQQIVAASAEDGDTARSRLDAGEDFVTVAAELSTEPSLAEPGNEQSCVMRTQLRGLFGDQVDGAGEGDLLGSASSQGDPEVWLVLRVWAEQPASFEQARSMIESQVPDNSEAAVAELLADMYASADVQVDPRFGTWTPDSGQVVAPTDPLAPAAAVEAVGEADAP